MGRKGIRLGPVRRQEGEIWLPTVGPFKVVQAWHSAESGRVKVVHECHYADSWKISCDLYPLSKQIQ